MTEETNPKQKNFAIYVKMRTGQTRFVVLGVSPQNCFELLPLALSNWTRWDIQQFDEAWVAQWNEKSQNWIPLKIPVVSKEMVRSIILTNSKTSTHNFVIKDNK